MRKTIVKIIEKGRLMVLDMQKNLIEKICYVIENLGEKDTLEYLRISNKIANILNEKFY